MMGNGEGVNGGDPSLQYFAVGSALTQMDSITSVSASRSVKGASIAEKDVSLL